MYIQNTVITSHNIYFTVTERNPWSVQHLWFFSWLSYLPKKSPEGTDTCPSLHLPPKSFDFLLEHLQGFGRVGWRRQTKCRCLWSVGYQHTGWVASCRLAQLRILKISFTLKCPVTSGIRCRYMVTKYVDCILTEANYHNWLFCVLFGNKKCSTRVHVEICPALRKIYERGFKVEVYKNMSRDMVKD